MEIYKSVRDENVRFVNDLADADQFQASDYFFPTPHSLSFNFKKNIEIRSRNPNIRF